MSEENGTTNVLWLLGGIVLGGVIVYSAMTFWGGGDDDDRPPIIVKNGSIQFETSVGWEADGGHWKPKQANGKKVKEFEAAISGASNNCTSLRGTHFVITYSPSDIVKENFHLILGSKEPKVQPHALLTHDGDKLLTYGKATAGWVSRILSYPSGSACDFPDKQGKVEIKHVYE